MDRKSLNDIREIDFIIARKFPYLLLKRWKDGKISELQFERLKELISNLHECMEYIADYKVYRINPTNRSFNEVVVELHEPERRCQHERR